MEDFVAQVERVLHEIHIDVVFRVNFRNCPAIAIEDVLGTDLDDDLVQEIVAAVRARLKEEIKRDEFYRRQLMEWHREHEATTEKEIKHALNRVREL